jgi:hypothetical protein
MDLLIVLVKQANKVVGRVWPRRGAEQVSLRVHICRASLDRSFANRAKGDEIIGQSESLNGRLPE